MPTIPVLRRATAIAATSLLALAACGDDDEADSSADDGASEDDGTGDGEAPDGGAEVEVLRIHVTNDDGIEAPGIDAVAEALAALDDVEVHVAAPAEDWSGSGDSRLEDTEDDVELAAEETETSGGTAGLGVDGTPADSVVWAHENYFGSDAEPPHLTVSGANGGQNLGELVYISGTVGAARESARHDVPALAVSQGFGGDMEVTDYDELDYAAAVPLVVDWVEEHREALLAGDLDLDTVANLNVPTCLEGEVRGLVETTRQVTPPEDGPGPLDGADCTSDEDPDGLDDVEAFVAGFATLTSVEIEEPDPGDAAADEADPDEGDSDEDADDSDDAADEDADGDDSGDDSGDDGDGND